MENHSVNRDIIVMLGTIEWILEDEQLSTSKGREHPIGRTSCSCEPSIGRDFQGCLVRQRFSLSRVFARTRRHRRHRSLRCDCQALQCPRLETDND